MTADTSAESREVAANNVVRFLILWVIAATIWALMSLKIKNEKSTRLGIPWLGFKLLPVNGRPASRVAFLSSKRPSGSQDESIRFCRDQRPYRPFGHQA